MQQSMQSDYMSGRDEPANKPVALPIGLSANAVAEYRVDVQIDASNGLPKSASHESLVGIPEGLGKRTVRMY